MTPLRIAWADEAREIFLEYLFFISEKDLGAAERLFDQVERSLEPVSYFPHSGRPGRVPGTREVVSHPNYIAIYEVHDDFILIVDFTHVKKLYPQATTERVGSAGVWCARRIVQIRDVHHSRPDRPGLGAALTVAAPSSP